MRVCDFYLHIFRLICMCFSFTFLDFIVRVYRVSFNMYHLPTSKCMHGMNQTEAEYSRHGNRSQRASYSQIGPVVLDV